MDIQFVRMVRTDSSERFVLLGADGAEVGMFDLHFLTSGSVIGSLILLDAQLAESAEKLLHKIDEELLPAVSLDEKNLSFTVVKGELIGTFSSNDEDE
nr:hypothetical protein [Blastopirellula marina]